MQDTTGRFLRVLRFLLVSKTKHKLLEIQGTISLCVLTCFITIGNYGSVVLISLKKIALKRAAIRSTGKQKDEPEASTAVSNQHQSLRSLETK